MRKPRGIAQTLSTLLLLPILSGADATWLIGLLAQEPPALPVSVDLVRLDVVVVDRDNRPVPGLREADFEVSEEGRPRPVLTFEGVHIPEGRPRPIIGDEALRVSRTVAAVPQEGRYLLVFFDDLHVSSAAAQQLRGRLRSLLRSELREGDWITIVAPGKGLWWTARNAFEYEQLGTIVDSLSGQLVRNPFQDPISEWQAMQEVEREVSVAPRPPRMPGRASPSIAADPPYHAQEIYDAALRRIRRSLGVLEDAVRAVSGFRGHKSLVLFSEGFIRSPAIPNYDRVIEAARQAQVSVYFVDPLGLTSGLPTADLGASPLTTTMVSPGVARELQTAGAAAITAATGGRELSGNDIASSVQQALQDASIYYLIGFEPRDGKPGLRTVEVRVRGEGLRVLAKPKYYWRPPAPKGSSAERALHAVVDETALPLAVRIASIATSAKGEVEATASVEIGPSPTILQGDAVTLTIEAYGLEGGPPIRYEIKTRLAESGTATIVARALRLRAGVWQARFVVEHKRTASLGSALHTFILDPLIQTDGR